MVSQLEKKCSKGVTRQGPRRIRRQRLLPSLSRYEAQERSHRGAGEAGGLGDLILGYPARDEHAERDELHRELGHARFRCLTLARFPEQARDLVRQTLEEGRPWTTAL